ncbi:MAG: type VI secretion system lipoprotein TssJ [Methylococcales bacterium]|nr:type VI secretion system lipoprotein TssJ [Methylococcales bacterium]
MNSIRKGFILLVLLLSGCSSDPEKPEVPPTIVDATITVSAQVNPDIYNRASPVVVRIFELKSIGAFNESDFYELFEDHDSALGSDLLGSEKFHLNPGDIHSLTHNASPETKFIAVIAAYRNINQAIWRDSVAITANKTTQIMVVANKLTISVWKK